MRLASLSLMALSLAAIMGGCSSNTDVGGAAGTGNTVNPYHPTPNGTPMNEAEACKVLVDAINKAAASLGSACTIQAPQCPEYIQKSAPSQPVCMQWDEGTIMGCKSFYASYTTCSDFSNRPCIIGYIPNSAPKGCPAVDAGTDAMVTEGGTDAKPQDDVVVPDDVIVQEDTTPQSDVVVPTDATGVDSASTD